MRTKHNLNKIAAEIETEAYAKGWNDALATVFASLRNVPKKGGSDATGTPGTAVRRPRKDSDAWRVLEQIKKSPGLTGAEIVEALEKEGTPVKERTVRTALHRLRAKFIKQQDERWFPL